MNETLTITSRQKHIIIGKLLGDGHLETANGRTFRLKIEHAYSQKEYVDWLYEELQTIAASPPKIKLQTVRGTIYKKYWFNTRYSVSFVFYAKQFYKNGVKEVPRFMHRWMTPLTLAVWFMDDGSVKFSSHRARILNTQGFSKKDTSLLLEALHRRYQLHCQLRKQKEGDQIMILAESANAFAKIIQEHIHPSMRYKLRGLG